MIFYGIGVLGENLTIVALGADKELASELADYLSQLGYIVDTISTPLQTVSSAIAICVFAAYLVAVIVLAILFRKKSDEFRNEDTRDAYFENTPSDTATSAGTTWATRLTSLKENTYTKKTIPTTITSRAAETCLTNSIFD